MPALCFHRYLMSRKASTGEGGEAKAALRTPGTSHWVLSHYDLGIDFPDRLAR